MQQLSTYVITSKYNWILCTVEKKARLGGYHTEHQNTPLLARCSYQDDCEE